MKVTVFNGPRRNFEQIIPTERVWTLTNLVRFIDSKNKDSEIPLEECETLVIHSDEYSGVADFFIEGFLIYSLTFSETIGYEEIFLHNPPMKILNQIKSSQVGIEVIMKNHKYTKLTKKNLSQLKMEFDNEIFGQSHVKTELLRTLYPLTNKGSHKPVVIMLYGPSSVGKTETAKFVNRMVSKKKSLLRKQLSMFHNENFINYIFGDKSNSFAKDLLDRETNVILLDEFDKAHPMFYSAFYQLFDEGVYTDKYYEVEMKNTVIFCTTNFLNQNEMKQKLGDPIFSRFDHFIEFKSLSVHAKESIIEITYDRELSRFDFEDQLLIEGINIKDNLKAKVASLNNAREIQKVLIQMMAHPLIERL